MNAKLFPILSALGRLTPGLMLFLLTRDALANPTGVTVQSGSATFSVNGSQYTVNVGNNAVLNWQHFDIANGEQTVFNQPSASSIVWNRINDPHPSQIYGSIQANGVVVLLNSSGFYFGPNSFVSAAGLVVSTANCTPPQNAGGAWEFNGPPPLASIVNYGTIKVGNGGSAFLIADQVENHGTVEAPGGSIGFAAGQTVTLSERPDGRGMSMEVRLPQGSVDNYGNVIADGGTVALNANVVNQNGLVQANSVSAQNGVIELVAATDLNLGAGSEILARGDGSAANSTGGTVTLKSGDIFRDAAGSTIITAGGANGGNGGDIEVSAPNIASLNTAMDASAQAGFVGGEFLLDPVNIILGTSGSGTVPANGTVGSSGSGTLSLDVNSAFANKNFSLIKLQASGDITVASGTVWDLSASTGKTSGQMSLQAGGNIIVSDSAQIFDANQWAVSLQAGFYFLNNTVTPGTGSVLLNGSGSIKIAQGNLTLTAGRDITVGSGYAITTGGGSITAHALTGNIDTGSDAQGYTFVPNATTIGTAYNLSHGLGGISTMAGGDVNLTAGGNISSVLPGKKGYFYNGNFLSALNSDFNTAGAGAYGPQAGNVNLIAGGNVTGNYLVANGVGSLFAGVQMDASGNAVKDSGGQYVLGSTGSAGTSALTPNLALNLIKGGWNVTAAQNIYLQEVRNPNGIFNVNGATAMKHYFDYAPGDFVNLSAGNAVQLGGTSSSLPRVDTLNVPMIYPGILNVNAGAGGITLVGDSIFNQMILFPSPQGGLVMNTTGGGSLNGKLPTSAGAPLIFNLVVSDSGSSQYKNSTSFGLNDHASTPIHLNHETPVELNISGDMNLTLLSSPEAAQVNVVGNMNNCRFQAMNLADSDISSISVGQAAKLNLEAAGILNPATDGGLVVGGDIINRSAFTSVDLTGVLGAAAPDLSALARSLSGTVSAATLINSLYYNPVTKVLTYQNIPGVSIASIVQLLQNLTVQKVDASGNPLWLDPAQTEPDTEVVSVLNAATATALQARYNALGAIPASNLGYAIGGGGQFNITARNLDLGTTAGIQSKGAGFDRIGSTYPLANLFTHGADININLAGNLDMYSSSIATLNGGNIAINAGGSVNVGSSDFNVTSTGARGIYTASLGDVSVLAHGDVNVNGSRIAAYDGGNVTVESFNGNVNAGNGGGGYVVLTAYYVDPITRQVYTDNPTIPGSGILATTFPPRDERYPAPISSIGNILVEAPNGDIKANKGGIVQLVLNGANGLNSTVTVLAGYELRDNLGNRVDAAQTANGTAVKVSDGHNIDATGSGIIAQNAALEASGKIDGVIFAQGNINLSAVGNVNVTALAQGNVNVSSGGNISGTIVGVGGISASGSSIDASLLSQNVSASGDTSGGTQGFAQGTAANAASTGASAEDTKSTKKSETTDAEDPKKKRGIALAQKVSRVTVILPAKKETSEVNTHTPKI
jgi:filamentous hemagglutinin family protein